LSIMYIVSFNIIFYKLPILFYYLVPLMYTILLLLNNHKLYPYTKMLLLLPIISDIMLPNHIAIYILKNKYTIFRSYLIFFMTTILTSGILFFYSDFKKCSPNNIDTYSIAVDKKMNRVVISDLSNAINKEQKIMEEIEHFENFIIDNGNSIQKYHITRICRLQQIAFNEQKEEYYLFDGGTGIFNILDSNNFKLKRTKKIIKKTDPRFSDRIAYDNQSNTIALIIESYNKLIIIDMNTLNIINEVKTTGGEDFILYNPFRNSYIITFWWFSMKYMLEYSLNTNLLSKIEMDYCQGYSALSVRNQELYIAYPQKARIYVYDAQTYQLKRKIRAHYTVKNITYDEDLNILIAPSYFTGYVDIFLMDGNDKLIWSDWVGYMLRESRFDSKKTTLFITSQFDLYKKSIDIKSLIKK